MERIYQCALAGIIIGAIGIFAVNKHSATYPKQGRTLASSMYDSGWIAFDSNPLVLDAENMDLSRFRDFDLQVRGSSLFGNARDFITVPGTFSQISVEGSQAHSLGWTTITEGTKLTFRTVSGAAGESPVLPGLTGLITLEPGSGLEIRFVSR